MTFLISAKDISVIRQGKAVLDKVSLDINPGGFTTVVGPNGAGKTTLLKTVMGLVPCDGGTIRRRADLRIGYVPQRLDTDQAMPMTAKRFLTLRKKTKAAELETVIAETGTAGLLARALHELSGGEMQRLLMARALLGNPDLLVLDEPAQNLDVSGQLSLYALVDKIYAQRRLAVLMVSHDLHLVMSSTRHVVCLYHHISCQGQPRTITRDPAFRSVFGDDMARLMAVYAHAPGSDHDCAAHGHEFHEHNDGKEGQGCGHVE
jgi:zinc transport system ATP-binding protein